MREPGLQIALGICVAAAVAAGQAAADPYPPPARRTPVDDATMGRQLQRGLAGVTLGVLEVPGTIVEQTRESGPLVGLAVGLTQGVGRFVTRELVGVYQVLGAPFGVTSAAQDPEFPWQRFGSGLPPLAVDPFEREATELGWIRGVELTRAPGSLRAAFPGDLLFDVGSARISPAAEPRLIGLAETLLRHPDIQIEVQGHSDSSGPAHRNVELSARRAEAVREFLMANGVPGERIRTTGFGSSRPVASNASAGGRRANRRVEVELTQPVAALR